MSIFYFPTTIRIEEGTQTRYMFDDLLAQAYVYPLDIDDCDLMIDSLTIEEIDEIMKLVAEIRSRK